MLRFVTNCKLLLPQVRPLEHPERLSTPSPKSSPIHQRKSSSGSGGGDKSSRNNKPPPRSSAPSLTTITEEPSWHSSAQSVQSSMQSIVVQPEVVVETTTYNGSDSASGRSTPTSKSQHSGAITTKVSCDRELHSCGDSDTKYIIEFETDILVSLTNKMFSYFTGNRHGKHQSGGGHTWR